MNINEAIELLESLKEEYGGEMPLYVSKDAEGNKFRPLDNEYSAMIDTGDEIRPFDEDEDDGDEEIVALSLWPI